MSNIFDTIANRGNHIDKTVECAVNGCTQEFNQAAPQTIPVELGFTQCARQLVDRPAIREYGMTIGYEESLAQRHLPETAQSFLLTVAELTPEQVAAMSTQERDLVEAVTNALDARARGEDCTPFAAAIQACADVIDDMGSRATQTAQNALQCLVADPSLGNLAIKEAGLFEAGNYTIKPKA